MTLSDPIEKIRGVGSSRADVLRESGVFTVNDLLTYLPYAYEDSRDILSVSELKAKISELPLWEIAKTKFAVKGLVRKISNFRTRNGLFIITAQVESLTEPSQSLKVIWFNQPYIVQQIHEGNSVVFFGKVQRVGGTFKIKTPKFEVCGDSDELQKLGKIIPIYRRAKTVTSTYLRKYIVQILDEVSMNEYLNPETLARYSIPSLQESLRKVHMPIDPNEVAIGVRRLAIQELIELRDDYDGKFATNKKSLKSSDIAKQLAKTIGSWIPKLPFTLTKGQESAIASVLEVVGNGEYLDSLLYGDVGSGKTIIAMLLAFAFASSLQSSILIAPTTILASQHLKTAKKLVDLLGMNEKITIQEVSAKQKNRESSGLPTLFIGTQAILHDKKIMKDDSIALVCIDEQHRFGVEQRAALKSDGRHVITLSATPIPRTLALSFLGFSQAIFLTEKPQGRKEIISRVVPQSKEDVTYKWIEKHLLAGEQVYFVFPRIESEDESEKQSLIAMAELLKSQYFATIPSAILHGGMKEEEKNLVMADFSAGKIRLLFSTSVIEVGVDVANATIIAIHGAEMFGLAQLHQLRGRVGRSSDQGYCFLFSEEEVGPAYERLEFFSMHSDGNDVSEYDLSHRGTGTIAGTVQSGQSELKIATLNDLALVKEAMTIYEQLKSSKASIPRYIRVKSG